MKFFLIILISQAMFHPAIGQCITAKSLWDSIVYLRQSDVADTVQLRQMQSFIKGARACGYENDSVYVLLLQRTGALYSYQSDFQQAISHTWKAVKLFNQIASRNSMSPALQVKNFFNLYLYYDLSGDEQSVSGVIDSCIVLSVHSGYADKYTLDALDEKSTSQLESGDYHGCIKTAQLADFLMKGNAEHYSMEEREKMIRLFSTRLNAMIFLQQYNDAEGLLVERKNEYLQLNNGNRLGNWYALMGKLRRRQNRFEETIALLRKSVTCHLKGGYPEGAAESLNNIGFVYLDNLQEFNKALPYFKQALRYASGVEALNIHANIGNSYVKLKHFKQAFSAFQRAFDQVSPGMNEVKLLDSRDSSITANYAEYLLRLEMYKGDAYLSFYRETGDQSLLRDAIAVYKCADQLLNQMKAIQSDFQSKLFWRSDARQLYEHGIEAARLANNVAIALYFFEKSRAVLLSDQIQLRKLLTKEEFSEYAAVKTTIAGLESSQLYTPAVNSGDEQKLFTYRLQLGNIEKQIRERRLMEDQSVVTIPEIHEKILDEHQLFLETYTGENSVFVLAISKERSVLNKISRLEFDTVLKKYTGYLADHASINRNFEHFTKISSQLYSLLFKNISPGAGRIVISLDGVLFPFESLVVSSKGSTIKYFIKDHPVSYTYNARYFINGINEKNKNRQIRFTGFAPVNYPVNLNLMPLNGSNHSIDLVGNYFQRSDNFKLSKASRASFIDHYSKSDLILLYTHGAYKSDKNEPVLFFSDSALYLSELAGEQKPKTRLIVLAACETGLGANYEGEGVFSFSRGFAAIGIPSSITTLWAVNKETTFEVTELFYNYLAQGHPTDIALQKAKLAFIQSSSGARSLPYYWAGPVLIGNSDPIVVPHSEAPFWILLISLIAAGLAGIIIVKRLK